jgi:proteasome lid subunit RPN8/RPN11
MDQVTQLPPIDRLYLTRAQWEQLCDEAERHAPEEACGLLAGQSERVKVVIPVTNALHSQVRYRMAPAEQLKAFLEIERQGWELIGIYHTHPLGPEGPSPTDIAEAYYPESVYMILSRQTGSWHCRGFYIRDGRISEVAIQFEESKS